MARPLRLAAIAIAATLPAWAAAEDYVGAIKLPRSVQQFGSSFSLASEPVSAFSPWQAGSAPWRTDNGMRLRLGYQYSRYLSVESDFVDYGRGPADVFASPGNLVSAFRSTGYGVSTVATVPVWRSFSFYGRLGAYHGEARNEFSSYSTQLLSGDPSRATHWRYGLGMRYDFSQRLGVHADIERYTPLGTPMGEPDADQFSIGLNWRF